MPAKRASAALLSRIGEAAMKEYGRSDLYVAPAPPGLGLGSAHVQVLAEPEEHRLDKPASVARLVEIARVVDSIQRREDALSTPDQDPGFLSDVFPKLMKNVRFFAAPLSEEERRRYDQAQAVRFKDAPFVKTPDYEEFCLLRADLEKKEVAREEMRHNLESVKDPAQRDALRHDLDSLDKLCAEKREALDALDKAHAFRAAEDVVAAAERRMDETPPSIRAALDTMSIFQLTDPVSNVTHVACGFFPSQLAEENWTSLRLTREDVAHGHETGEHSAADEIDDADIDWITIEVQTLVCERPWLWPPLFANRSWDWETPSDAVAGAAGGGLIPGYIHALICARNLTIKTKLGAQAKPSPAAVSPLSVSSFLMRAIAPRQTAHPIGLAAAAPFAPGFFVPPGPVVPGGAGHAGVIVRDHRVAAPLVLRGRLVDEAGRPIVQAALTLEGLAGRSAISGPDGAFAFPGVRPGSYRVRVQKPGFMITTAPATVPQTSPFTIRIKALPLPQAMVRLQSDDGQPFVGTAKVVIQTAAGQRVESMDGRSQAAFSLPAGAATFSLASVEADRISPATATVQLAPGQPQPTVTFTISRAPVLRNPEIQLLAFVCRKVPPPCPSPDPALRR